MESKISIEESEEISKRVSKLPNEVRLFNLKIFSIIEEHKSTDKDYKTLIHEYIR